MRLATQRAFAVGVMDVPAERLANSEYHDGDQMEMTERVSPPRADLEEDAAAAWGLDSDEDEESEEEGACTSAPVSYTHLTLPTNREV